MLKETEDLKGLKVLKVHKENQADQEQLVYKDLGVWQEGLDYLGKTV